MILMEEKQTKMLKDCKNARTNHLYQRQPFASIALTATLDESQSPIILATLATLSLRWQQSCQKQQYQSKSKYQQWP